MRIALRTSGGRGEYEIAGSHASIVVGDVIDHEIVVELIPGHAMATGNFVRRINGKTRIRLADTSLNQHLYLILADALLLPKPKRELGITPGGKLQLVDNNYSLISIQFDVVAKKDKKLVIRPTDLVLSNSDDDLARIDVVERIRILIDVWEKAISVHSMFANLIKEHKEAFMLADASLLRSVAKKIRTAFADPGDPLRQIVQSVGLMGDYSYWMALHQTDVEEHIVEEDFSSLQEAARNRLKIWRQQAMRGADGARFSKAVRKAYNETCMFTGNYLPGTLAFGAPGVDSAHILPWADYELNKVSNGLCVNKLCHWAFDAGILCLNFDTAASEYVLTISPAGKKAEDMKQINLEPFHKIEGVIPRVRLPTNKSDWPNPEFLRRYNQSFLS